jgi:phage gp36-like protein
MPYLARADLLEQLSEQQLVQLTDDEKLGIANETRIAEAIARAEAEADGYFATKYTVPVVPVTALVKALCVDIAVYRLWLRRQRVPEAARQGYDDAVGKLRDIAKGLLTLGVDPTPVASSQGAAGEASGDERIFSRDKLGGF